MAAKKGVGLFVERSSRAGGTAAFFLMMGLLVSCGPTYKRDTIQEDIKRLAKKEYKLDVQVVSVGETIGVRYAVKNVLGEMVAEDQLLWKQVDDLLLVLSRVALSCDRPPQFMVLDVMDEENPRVHVVFTRYCRDVRKVAAEGLSRTQYTERLLIDFVIGNKTRPFDPSDGDLVHFMLMALDTDETAPKINEFEFKDISFPEFFAEVAGKTAKRVLKDEGVVDKNFEIRSVEGTRETAVGQTGTVVRFDLKPVTSKAFSRKSFASDIFPPLEKAMRELLRSYQWKGGGPVTLINTGTMERRVVPGLP